MPALPEIVLAVGAMALLMLGAFAASARRRSSISASILLLVAAACHRRPALPDGTTFGGSFVVDDFARFMKILALRRLGRRDPDVARLSQRPRSSRTFEYPILILLSTRRHDAC